MKQKSKTCSTGHDTGVSYRRGLHTSLDLERTSKRARKLGRLMKQVGRWQRHGLTQGPGGEILDLGLEEVSDEAGQV